MGNFNCFALPLIVYNRVCLRTVVVALTVRDGYAIRAWLASDIALVISCVKSKHENSSLFTIINLVNHRESFAGVFLNIWLLEVNVLTNNYVGMLQRNSMIAQHRLTVLTHIYNYLSSKVRCLILFSTDS
jgi:hypothetical protein